MAFVFRLLSSDASHSLFKKLWENIRNYGKGKDEYLKHLAASSRYTWLSIDDVLTYFFNNYSRGAQEKMMVT